MTGKKEARTVVVIGGGPAGLMAAETIAAQGWQVDVYDAMPSVGRKFLLAGKGGMNLTHSEPQAAFVQRYGNRRAEIAALLQDFGAEDVRHWAQELGIATFIGSSGRVFPTDMKAAPLLRAWLHRMRECGVRFHMRHRWIGWKDGALLFSSADGERRVQADVAVLALGGGSWARLGSDAAWVPLLQQQQVEVTPLQPANCGFDVGWSEHFRQHHAGQPLTSVIAHVKDTMGNPVSRQGQFVVTEGGVEGSLIYALSAPLRDLIAAEGQAVLHLDLAPGKSQQRVNSEVLHPRGSRSWSSHLQGRLGLDGVKTALLRECLPAEYFQQPELLAQAVKALPVVLRAPRPIDEAISSAGGITFAAMNEHLMLRALPGVFCAGEMLDWEAPTGGYLLTACFASGRRAGVGVLEWLHR
ncbi:TIGR03862 family flavoprotein [Undibacterium sp. TJN25]|uniref:TIGR03862 family flavoprotein n=1 Tax=Undibacterium sp. TJN25 TaxID=3413056 RepID=UPI003BF3DE7B